MTASSLPVVGAAMPIALLPEYVDWLLAEQRDLELQDAFNPRVLDGDWAPLARQARSLLDGYTGRLGIHGPFEGLALASRDPKVQALASGRLCQAVEFGGHLGATHMVIHSPFMFFGGPFLPHSAASELAQQIECAHATLAPVLALARQIGCALVIEDIEDKNPAPLLALVRSFASEQVRVSIDTGHAYITHLAGGPTPDGWVRACGDLLGHLHLQDTDGQYDRHWAPGDGAINWFALFEELAALSHRPRLIIEVRDKRAIGRAAAWLTQRGLVR